MKKLLILTVLVISVLGVGVAQAGTCTGTGCNCQDPAATFCNSDAKTVWTVELRPYAGAPLTGWVELRHSNTCKANWAKVTVNGGSSYVHLSMNTSSGSTISCTRYPASGDVYVGSAYGNMNGATSMACGSIKATQTLYAVNCTPTWNAATNY